MKVITESELRDIYKKAPFTSFDLPSGMKLTPAASQFLSERKIKVLRDGIAESILAAEDKRFHVSAPTPAYPRLSPQPQPLAAGNREPQAVYTVHQGVQAAATAPPVQPIQPIQQAQPVQQAQPIQPVQPIKPLGAEDLSPSAASRYKKDTTAQNMDTSHTDHTKPEHMTNLRGAELVPKIHPLIAFRGQLDSFEAELLELVIDVEAGGFKKLAGDLSELLEYSRGIMRAEVMQEPLAPMVICGWNSDEIRERSHYPNKFYNVNHFTPQPHHGKIMAQLNGLRAKSREMELAAEHAFYNLETGETERDDILKAVNRFSSLIYVYMLQLLGGVYKYGS